ncbi:LysM peptidoglycan-binding domain-containing protein [Caldibacillus lycopersici]|uniref:LysM peptidoglycan-binding domain-containing protein n=1 Tax=Perspicuibacillus lycopersici TaxID=1325689 RepID=A0AAE3IZL6_9BACI|nr:LysM peptidoglycan-binding domain-containing protein [Perspicuibacillus lycopersici]MCU9614970.1 LysM peptidoglycan-binding domain-containing protein [Perspicuibacillus lycopersici]
MQSFYTVRPNDTLFNIANRWSLPVESLIAANNIAPPYTIFVGQQLSIPPGVDVYRVKQGDTVNQIAQAYGIDPSVIIAANGLQPPYVIFPEQLLKIPPGVSYYVVQPGDSLYLIARRYNVTTNGQVNINRLRQANQLTSDVLFPGMRLLIPYAPPGGQGRLAYFSNQSGNYDLWLYYPSNGASQQITLGLGESFSIPFWSPDSSKIAFVGKNAILYVINLANNTIASIDQFSEGLGVFVDWSPDSQKLVYSKQNEITIYHVGTHQAQKISQQNVSDVQWFPNGEELLFQATDAFGVSQLFRMRSDGSSKQQLTENNEGRRNNIRLSPDGTYALYTTPGASVSLLKTIELATGRIFDVPGGPLGKNYYPEWSSDFSSIAYSSSTFEDRGYFSLIRTTDKQGTRDRTVAISNCYGTPVTWTPNGRKVAYLSGCTLETGASEIWLLDLNHLVPIPLVKGGNIVSLQWSPVLTSLMKQTYTNTRLKVQLQFPASWAPSLLSEDRFEGEDGFFQVSALASNASLEEVCHSDAYHQLMPYGSEPHIIPTQIQNEEACFIFPSEDQPPQMNHQASLIVRYPTPVVLNGMTYNFFILWADKNHIEEISRTLKFLSEL